jgi:hypothetical protein
MMDLGGVPAAKTGPIRTVDGSKNCKVRAVAIDFDLLTRAVDQAAAEKDNLTAATSASSISNSISLPPVSPIVGRVQEIASLLNVNLGGNRETTKEKYDDDLSGLLGEKPETKEVPTPVYSTDVRAKYADKLKSRGGLSGVDHAKRELDTTLQKGDAAGHLAARGAAISQSTGGTKWMALSGTGNLLTYISNRSMKLALLPVPHQHKPAVEKRMKEFSRQLAHVSFDLLIEKGDEATDILKLMMKKLEVDPIATIIVSDRDDYLQAAKDEGMVACRVRPTNGKRGNVSAHYNAESVGQVEDVVNEINGISFQALGSAKR